MLQISHNLFCRDYRGRKRITYRTAADDVDVLAQFRADVPNPEEEALRQLDREALRRAISAARALSGGGQLSSSRAFPARKRRR